MGAVTRYRTLEHIAQAARPYPVSSLAELNSGLCLFAAAFLGHNDAIHFAEAGLRGTAVDINRERLAEMEALYPDEWDFWAEDAWAFADFARRAGRTWDVVSADTFTGDATLRSITHLDAWTSLARRLVTATITDAEIPLLRTAVPDGWEAWIVIRAKGIYWLALERAT